MLSTAGFFELAPGLATRITAGIVANHILAMNSLKVSHIAHFPDAAS